jgi:hypothetical protein
MRAALAVGGNGYPLVRQGVKTDFARLAPRRQAAVVRRVFRRPCLGGVGVVEVDQFPAVGEPGAGDSRHEPCPLVVQQLNNIVPQSAQKRRESNKK